MRHLFHAQPMTAMGGKRTLRIEKSRRFQARDGSLSGTSVAAAQPSVEQPLAHSPRPPYPR
jgi:hypothetical protein